MRRWGDLPEVVRWILFLPALLIAWWAFGVLTVFGQFIGGNTGGFVARLFATALSVSSFFWLVFVLAPRAKAVVGWLFFIPIMLFTVLALILCAGRSLGILGLLPMLPPPEWAKWERTDSIELGQVLVWLVVGPLSFSHCLGVERERTH